MLAHATDGPERKIPRTGKRAPNADDGFEIHEDTKSSGISEPPNDHDLRYARLLEAITKSAITTREEVTAQVVARGDRSDKHTTDQIDHSQKLTAIQMDKLTTDIEKLQIIFTQGIKSCKDRIQQQ